MKKSNCFFILLFLFVFINLFIVEDIPIIVINSCKIWLYNLLPTIFPFYIVVDLLVNYDFIKIIEFSLEKPFYKMFGLKSSAIFILIFSMLTGFPSGAKYISNLLKENLISIEEANRLIMFTHFSNPLFIINIIGLTILKNKFLGFLILLSHFLSNFVIAFFIKANTNIESTNISLKPNTFGKILSKSIIDSFNSLLIILGNLIVFQILLKITFYYFNFSQVLKTIISLLIELTSGLFSLNNLNINIKFKALTITTALSFGGFCIHSQVYSILSDTKVKYKNFLLGRVLQAIISPIFLLILLYIYRI